MATTQAKKALEYADKVSVFRQKDAISEGIHPQTLSRLCEKGFIVRESRGLYAVIDRDIDMHYTLVEVAKKIPHGIICLLSALSYYEIGTQLPGRIWVALDKGVKPPRIDYPPLKIVHFSGASFSEGVNLVEVSNVPIKITNQAKTIADCFKFRNKIGFDVAIEALRSCIRNRMCTSDELIQYARICRVEKIMKPYMEVLI